MHTNNHRGSSKKGGDCVWHTHMAILYHPNTVAIWKRFAIWIVDQFLRVRSLDNLRYLCIHVQDKLRAVAANPDYFTV